MLYSEYERQLIAEKQYDSISGVVEIKSDFGDKIIGKVSEVIDNPDTGLKAYVIQNDVGDITLLFKGSEMPGKEGWKPDWENNVKLGAQITYNRISPFEHELEKPTAQLKAAAGVLQEVLVKYPEAKISVYGHSLGSMDAQYALATVPPHQSHRIEGAWIYNGPNIYSVLSDVEQTNIDHLKHKITNYIDAKDKIGFGYPAKGSEGAVGLVKRVDSAIATKEVSKIAKTVDDVEKMGILDRALLGVEVFTAWIGDQHMWGGFRYHKDGRVKMTPQNQTLYEVELARYSHTQKQAQVAKQLAQLKTRYKESHGSANGTISAPEELYLDTSQASAVAGLLSSAAEVGQLEAKSLSQELLQTLEKLEKVTAKVPPGFSLSPSEVRAAYAEGGATRSSLVDQYMAHAEKNNTLMSELSQTFSSFDSQLQAGISELIATDQQLGAMFG